MPIDINRYKEILLKKFPNGFRINSKIEINRFKDQWTRQFGDIKINDDEIISTIKAMTIEYNNFVYLPEMMCNETVQKELIQYIETCFLEGKYNIYFDVLYEKFSSKFQEINNIEMLKALLQYINNGNYIIHRQLLVYFLCW